MYPWVSLAPLRHERKTRTSGTTTMGVPSFYRWVAEKYPKTIVDALETTDQPTTAPNPNKIEFDNLYLDMNGIIHPCVHPEGRPPPKCEEEMFALIYAYIDRLFHVIRPRRLLFMAIDGPAPRAKMNQQRSRRFKAAKESAEKKAVEHQLRAEALANDQEVPPEREGSGFDTNVITPGTAFMARLAQWLRYYIQLRQHSEPAWRAIRVILSDATVPGEGEHKIMEHIRRQRRMAGYDPNQHHVVHGLDADLIMLALATHEPHFTILREFQLDRKAKEKQDEQIAMGASIGPPKLQMLQVWVLREYLHKEFGGADEALFASVPGGFDLERVVDDFVFLCFFVGNDFLPHIPALEIRDGAIDMLIYAYKQLMPALRGYLTDSGRVHLPRTEAILKEVSAYEDEIFERKRRREEGLKRAQAARDVANGGSADKGAFGDLYPPREPQQRELLKKVEAYANAPIEARASELALPANMPGLLRASAHLYATMNGLISVNNPDRSVTIRSKKGGAAAQRPPPTAPTFEVDGNAGDFDFETRLKLRLMEKETELQTQVDEVRYGERGWKDRYYTHKLDMPKEDEAARRSVAAHYVHGLCWVLMYYYQGVQDWGWFYPFHYAPCASDLVGLSDFAKASFELGAAFSPFEQLMAVFPPASGHALPAAYRNLMTDPSSPVIDFYPIDFASDLNGKKFSWQAISILPFIDARRLRAALRPLRKLIEPEEAARDRHGSSILFVSTATPLGALCVRAAAEPAGLAFKSSDESAYGMHGRVRRCEAGRAAGSALLPPPAFNDSETAKAVAGSLTPLLFCESFAVEFDEPDAPLHLARLLPGQHLPPATLTHADMPKFSRDAKESSRLMEARFAPGSSNVRGNGPPRGGGRSGGRR